MDLDFSKDILQKLENFLKEYDKVFFLDCSEEESRIFSQMFIKHFLNKKIIILSVKNIIEEKQIDKIILSKNDAELLLKLYYTYEFSNKFIVLKKDKKYGNIFNYVKNGLISLEDAIAVF